MTPERLTRDLLDVMPYWHNKLVRPLKKSLRGKMSLDAYYCIQTVHRCGPLSVTELSQRMKVPKQRVSKLVDMLCTAGFLLRTEDLSDRRAVKIGVTKQAMDYIRNSYYQDEKSLAGLQKRLSPEELEELGSALETLLHLLPKLG